MKKYQSPKINVAELIRNNLLMDTNLNSLSDIYSDNSNIYLDEDKRMTLYFNERIFKLSKNIKSVLELGLGDGNSAKTFMGGGEK